MPYLSHFQEWHEMEAMRENNQKIRDESETWRHKFESLKKFAVDNKIPIPPELESP